MKKYMIFIYTLVIAVNLHAGQKKIDDGTLKLIKEKLSVALTNALNIKPGLTAQAKCFYAGKQFVYVEDLNQIKLLLEKEYPSEVKILDAVSVLKKATDAYTYECLK